MIEAYKYMPIPNGIIFLFEEGIQNFEKGISIEFAQKEGESFIALAGSHLIPLNEEILEIMESVDDIFIAISEIDEYRATFQGSSQLDKIAIGKIIAYASMHKQ